MRLETVTPASVPLVTVAQARDQLKLDFDDQDAVLAAYIAAATAWAEEFTTRVFIAKTLRGWLDVFPRAEAATGLRVMRLRGPVSAVAHVKTYDADDAVATLDPSTYIVDTIGNPGRIVLRAGNAWPTALRAANGIEVEFTAGVAQANAVPTPIFQAVLLLVGHWHRHRAETTEAQLKQIPFGVEALLNPYRVWAF